MNISVGEIYHIFNQGNNQEATYLELEDYVEFLTIFRKVVHPHCAVLAYCLMPNHFHFLISATEQSAVAKRIGNIESCELSNGFRLLQSSYAQYFNRKYKRSGSLFRQKAKAKSTSDGSGDYRYIAFHYIHQNPLQAGLVTRMEDWHYSSFPDYAGHRDGTLCDRTLAEALIGFSKDRFTTESYAEFDQSLLHHIYDQRDWKLVLPAELVSGSVVKGKGAKVRRGKSITKLENMSINTKNKVDRRNN